TLAVDRAAVVRPGDDARLVAGRLRRDLATPRPGLVPRPGTVHAPDQPGPGLAGRPGPGRLDRAAAVLAGAGPGRRVRRRGLDLVDRLGAGDGLPPRAGRDDDRRPIRGGGAGLGAGTAGDRGLAAGPAGRLGAGDDCGAGAGRALVRRAIL